MLKIQGIRHRPAPNHFLDTSTKPKQEKEIDKSKEKFATFTSGFKRNKLRPEPKRSLSSYLEQKNCMKTFNISVRQINRPIIPFEKCPKVIGNLSNKRDCCEFSTIDVYDNKIKNSFNVRQDKKGKGKGSQRKRNYSILENKIQSKEKQERDEPLDLKIVAEKITEEENFYLSPLKLYRRRIRNLQQLPPRLEFRTLFSIVKRKKEIVEEKKDPFMELSPWNSDNKELFF